MNKKILSLLDFYRVRDTIAGYCVSEEGKESLLHREPFSSKEIIDSYKNFSKECLDLLNLHKNFSFTYFPSTKKLHSFLGKEGASLESRDFLALGLLCRASLKVKESILQIEEKELPLLKETIEEIPVLNDAENAIFHIIDEDGNIKDLPEIKAIRNSILGIRKDIEKLIHSYTTDSSLKDILQSDVPTIRGERQVIALKSNFKGRIKGIVHEVSQSGQTIYLEPYDVVQKNNDLIQEEYRLSKEIKRILTELTFNLGSFKEDFEKADSLLVKLDEAFAVAAWGKINLCNFALDTSEEKNLSLLQARHPILGEKAVPIDIEFLKDSRIVIITGPNTGGKTVSLKTVALFAMLNQSGFPVPAKEGTSLPIFDEIYADIGDEQSMDQSLSTFSGHMKNIAEVMEKATSESLVLLDELGGGTDPQEGGAISMAILDNLIEKKSYVLVTTHHGILKNYGYTHKICVNASVEFDENTLSPTYHILMGVPGESHALEIAKRNGINSSVIAKAKDYMSNEQADVSALIKGLTAKHEDLLLLEKDYKDKQREILEKWRTVDLKELKLKQKELELRELGYKKLEKFTDESRKMLENLVRELREGEITREKTLKVKDFIKEMNKSIEEEKINLEQEKELKEKLRLEMEEKLKLQKEKFKEQQQKALEANERKAEKIKQELSGYASLKKKNKKEEPKVFKEGCSVIVKSSNQKGNLVRQDKKGSWTVQIGSLKMTIKESNLILVEDKEAKVNIEYIQDTSLSAEKPVFELRLLGMRYEEAMKSLEHQIDLAKINSFKNFSIIHGKGTGALQQGVSEYLKKCPYVESFNFAAPEDGGFGKTYVIMKL